MGYAVKVTALERGPRPMAAKTANKTSFKPGQPRPANAGRKPGTLNKKTIEFLSVLEANNFNPAAEYLRVYNEQMKIHEERKKRGNLAGCIEALTGASTSINNICQYVYPKKKSVEHTGEVGIKTFADFAAAAGVIDVTPQLPEPKKDD